MTARVLMFQGTGSDVGKSAIVAGLCRLARRRGLAVAPFKPQNMSNNAAVCADGGEIGRAQALQARAAGLAPSVHFNPVLLKPESDRHAQVIVQGHARHSASAGDYMAARHGLMDAVMDSFERLTVAYDLVLVEGAGSPAEVNLRARDIANMGFARRAEVPVCLIGDIDRGGVIASLVGTQAVLDPADAELVRSFLINKFRGDQRLFTDGVRIIEARTGWPCRGVVPWLAAARRLPQEDAVLPDEIPAAPAHARRVKIVAPMLSRLANFDDADPLRAEPAVDLQFVPPGRPLPRDADVVLLLGSKSTLGDLAFLRAQGWDHDILAHARSGGRVLGLCGGFQMLGRWVRDVHGVDGPAGRRRGLGLLDLETDMQPHKRTRTVAGHCAVTGAALQGYEIHSGTSSGSALARPLLYLGGAPDGARSADDRIEGSYLHGLFASDAFRSAWLERVRAGSASGFGYEAATDAALDELADGLERALDVDLLLDSATVPGGISAGRSR